MAELPRASKDSTWDLDPNMVMKVSHEIERNHGWEATMEVVELAMLAAEKILKKEA